MSTGSTALLSNASYAANEAGGQFGGPAQLLTGATLGGGVYQYSATYDALLRASDVKWTNGAGSTTFFDQARTFDGAGNVISASTTLPAGTDNQAFCYDEQNRLTWAGTGGYPPCGAPIQQGTLSGSSYSLNASYDNLGRIINGPTPGTYTYGDPAHVHALTAAQTYLCVSKCILTSSWTATYDAAGNMICRAPSTSAFCTSSTNTGAQLSYDVEGRLIAWQNAPTSPTSTAGFLYDGQGNRVEQQVTQSGTTTTTIYVGNLEQVSTTGTSTTTTTYYYAGSARIAEAVNGAFSYLAADGLGSAAVALDANGNVTASVLYKPYGAVRYSSGTMPTDYGFTGQHVDSATGLDYYNARYYDPVAGQFTSADTILLGDGYDIWGLSRYTYVEGNPESRVDPSGSVIQCADSCGGDEPTTTGTGTNDAPEYIPPPPDPVQVAYNVNLQNVKAMGTQRLLAIDQQLGGWDSLSSGTQVALFYLAHGGRADKFCGGQDDKCRADMKSAEQHVIELESALALALTLGVTDSSPSLRPDYPQQFGKRGGGAVKYMTGPPNSVIRGSDGRIYVTDSNGRVILDITKDRVKVVIPGQGFQKGSKRPPTEEELRMLEIMWPDRK